MTPDSPGRRKRPHRERRFDGGPAAGPATWLTVAQAQRELGGCGRTYIYALLAKGLLESVNPGGRRRLISGESIRRLNEQAA